MDRNIVIIGGGAAGLMAAVSAALNRKATANINITILEHSDRVGKKLLQTGNGRCNYTNTRLSSGCYYAEDSSFVMNAVNAFNELRTIEFFDRELGVPPYIKDGYVYPRSEQASSVLDAFRIRCDRLGVKILTGCKVKSVKRRDSFIIETSLGTFNADKLILSTGLCAAPKTGSDGSGCDLAKNLGLNVTRPLPALCALYSDNKDFFKAVAGVRAKAAVRLFIDDINYYEDSGELQLTDYGLSGIPIFQLSRYVSKALADKKKVEVAVDFLPGIADAYVLLRDRIDRFSDITSDELGIGLINKKLWRALLKLSGINLSSRAAKEADENIKRLSANLKDFRFNIVSTADFDKAQVCTGGVVTEDIDYKTMSSKKDPDLYLAGELIDVDGKCGGYNLQWAWTSGYIAGLSCVRGA